MIAWNDACTNGMVVIVLGDYTGDEARFEILEAPEDTYEIPSQTYVIPDDWWDSDDYLEHLAAQRSREQFARPPKRQGRGRDPAETRWAARKPRRHRHRRGRRTRRS